MLWLRLVFTPFQNCRASKAEKSGNTADPILTPKQGFSPEQAETGAYQMTLFQKKKLTALALASSVERIMDNQLQLLLTREGNNWFLEQFLCTPACTCPVHVVM